jgi:TATA-binding protein-associated factor
VICPATLVRHWEVEVYKYFPCRKVFQVLTLLGSPEERSTLLQNSLSSSNLIVLSYAVLRSDIAQILAAHPAKWCYCVLDEGHLLKNPATGMYEDDIAWFVAQFVVAVTAKAARQVTANNKLILSGTPIQNKVQELWAVFDFLMPCFLGDSKTFEKNFARPVAKGGCEGATAAAIAEGLEALKLLHQTVSETMD